VTQASAHELPVEDLDFPAFTIRTVKKMLDKVKPVVTPEMLKKYREFHGSDECF
jgi:SpoVK/Ycf46/Vps4 family AAA+-type ATPase